MSAIETFSSLSLQNIFYITHLHTRLFLINEAPINGIDKICKNAPNVALPDCRLLLIKAL